MCQKTLPKMVSTPMTAQERLNMLGSIANSGINTTIANPHQNPFNNLTKETKPNTDFHIRVSQVSNGFTVNVRQASHDATRIATDMGEVAGEIMAAIAEIQLGK